MFRAARKAGLNGKAVLEHAGFGTMNGPDGKPFKTRAGGVMKLYDLIAMATDEAQKRLAEAGLATEYPAEERDEIARKVGIAAIKFADLSNYRLTDYIFDLERFTRFEGKTGPYLQYAAVRIQSILRKAQAEGPAPAARAVLRSPEERALILQLLALARRDGRRRRTSARRTSCAITPSRSPRISAAFMPSTTSCPKRTILPARGAAGPVPA